MAGHGDSNDDPPEQKLPTLHGAPIDKPVVPQKSPALQFAGALDAATQYLPTGHDPVTVDKPVVEQKNPPIQTVGVVRPVKGQ